MLCIAHRGARRQAPENTLAAFARAIELGALAIELDVHCCEGTLVVIHDDTVSRTTNGRGRLAGFTLAGLRALDAGQGQAIPTLDEVLALVRGRAAVNIELKGEGTAPATARCLAQALATGPWQRQQFLVSSFRWDWLRAFRQDDARTGIGLLFDSPPVHLAETTRALQARAWHPEDRLLTTDLLAAARQQGVRVFPYTVNRPERIATLHGLGIDGVFTDYPERVLPYQQETTPAFFPQS